ncbi:MAG TPA: hypothetical protein VHQ90_10900 [Thermoanaerobaculia bacterium]|nr:hypothetical protein [Thermoanaerobaculia bacterium]
MKDIGKAETRETQLSRSWFLRIRNLISGALASVGGFAATALSAQARFQERIPRQVPSSRFPPGVGGVSPDSGGGGSGSGDFSLIGFLIVVAILCAVVWLCFKIYTKATDESALLSKVLGIFFYLIAAVAAAVAATNSRKGEVLETMFWAVLVTPLVSVIPISILICLPYLGIVHLKERAERRRERRTRP